MGIGYSCGRMFRPAGDVARCGGAAFMAPMVVGGFMARPAVRGAIDSYSKREQPNIALLCGIGLSLPILGLWWVVGSCGLVWLACRPEVVWWHWL